MFNFNKIALAEVINFGEARVDDELQAVPFVILQSKRKPKILRDLFINKSAFVADLKYVKLGDFLLVTIQSANSRVALELEMQSHGHILAGIFVRKKMVLEHSELGIAHRLVLNLETSVSDNIGLWEDELVNNYLRKKLQNDGISLDKLPALKVALSLQLKSSWES